MNNLKIKNIGWPEDFSLLLCFCPQIDQAVTILVNAVSLM